MLLSAQRPPFLCHFLLWWTYFLWPCAVYMYSVGMWPCIYVHVEARGQHQMSSSAALLRVSHWTYDSLNELDELARKPHRSSCVYCPNAGSTTPHYRAQLFMWVLGLWTHQIAQQMLYLLSDSSQPLFLGLDGNLWGKVGEGCKVLDRTAILGKKVLFLGWWLPINQDFWI